MAYNLFVSYDLISPGQNYEAVIAAIKQLAPTGWAKIHYSLFYVHSQLDHSAAFDHVRKALDTNDKLIVISAADAVWNGQPENVKALIQNQWNQP